jgi:peptide/nickel transport system permease protein
MYSTYTYKSNWWGFIGKRVLITVFVFIVFSFVVFGLHIYSPLSPVSPNGHIINDPPFMQADEVLKLRQSLYMNGPHVVEYFRWLGNFFSGDWGMSSMHGVSVKDMLF